MATNYKATAAQAGYIAHLVAEKGWEPADLRANYGQHARALGDYGNAYLAGDTFVQIARGMNKKAASKFIDLLLDDSAVWEFPEAPEPEEPEADAEPAEEAEEPAEADAPATIEDLDPIVRPREGLTKAQTRTMLRIDAKARRAALPFDEWSCAEIRPVFDTNEGLREMRIVRKHANIEDVFADGARNRGANGAAWVAEMTEIYRKAWQREQGGVFSSETSTHTLKALERRGLIEIIELVGRGFDKIKLGPNA